MRVSRVAAAGAALVVSGLSLAGCAADVASTADAVDAGSSGYSVCPSPTVNENPAYYEESGIPFLDDPTLYQSNDNWLYHNKGACVYGTNNAQVFTGPNQLGPAPYTIATGSPICNVNNPGSGTFPFNNFQASGNTNVQDLRSIVAEWLMVGIPNQEDIWQYLVTAPIKPFPSTWVNNFGPAYYFCGRWHGLSATYTPPAPLPQTDSVTLNSRVWDDNENTGICNNSTYTACTVEHVGQQVDAANYGYSINNAPLIVQINNNLGVNPNPDPNATTAPVDPSATLNLVGAPAVNQMILDPAGGNPTTISPAASGFFGAYAALPGQTNNQEQAFSAVYQVPQTSTDSGSAGSTFAIDITLDSTTGLPGVEGYSCTVQKQSTSSDARCDITYVGNADGVVRFLVDVHE